MTLRNVEPLSAPLQFNSTTTTLAANFQSILAQVANVQPLTIGANQSLDEGLLHNAYRAPPLGVGAALLADDRVDATVLALFNGAALHAPSLALNFISNALLDAKAGTSFFFA